MTQRYLYIIIVLLKGFVASSQTTSCIQFQPVFGSHHISFDSTYYLNSHDSIRLTAIRFYVSHIELLQQHKTVWKDPNPFHLMDVSNEKSMYINIPPDIVYNKLKFNLGIDSITNTSGAMGGDLDPTKGMYWTWQSGYINFKLEGTSNLCKTRHNEFQFHLGGYQYPYNSLQTVFVEVKNKQPVQLIIDFEKLFRQIQLSEQHHIMSPGKESMDFSEMIINSFSIKP